MKRPSMSELIHTQPVPASSVRCLHCRPTATGMRYLPREVFSPENTLRIGLTGSGKIFTPQAIPDSMPPGPPPVIMYDEYWQHTEKGGHHE